MGSDLPIDVARQATRLTRTRARSFYLASLFLPSGTRKEVHALYAYYRTVDDLADGPRARSHRREHLETLNRCERALRGQDCSTNPFVDGVTRLAARYEVPVEHLSMVIEGARFDLEMRTIQSTQELIHYSVLMAGSVGMVMSRLLGAADAQSLAAASDLGVAMQITNILRDVGEDLARGRIYLPLEELEARGYSEEALRQNVVDESFCAVMQSLAHLAREYYDSGMRGIPRLDRSSQFSIYLAATLYRRILDKIEEQEFNVFTHRASVRAAEKWMMTMPTYLAHRQVVRNRS